MLPRWVDAIGNGLDTILPVGQAVLILLAAWLVQALFRAVIQRLVNHRGLPPEMATVLRRVTGTLLTVTGVLLALQRLGVSGTVLWTAFTSFAAVGAVAFFAAWSVLSNIFCTVLIFTTRPFRLQDHIEILENGEKPGLKGRVVDLNLIYTTLQEVDAATGETGSVLQVPNSLFFQRVVRRWKGSAVPATWVAAAPKAEQPPTAP
jgi:small-conductance mechanosensitive channel